MKYCYGNQEEKEKYDKFIIKLKYNIRYKDDVPHDGFW
jgi:hypothetical protein